MLAVLVFVLVALAIILDAVLWAWRHDSLQPSEQERVDLEFERIVAALDRPGR